MAGGTVAGSGGYDIYHLNSMEKDGDGLVISFRVLDAVYRRLRRRSRPVEARRDNVPGKSLQVDGDPVLAAPTPDPGGPLAGQHDARILPAETSPSTTTARISPAPPGRSAAARARGALHDRRGGDDRHHVEQRPTRRRPRCAAAGRASSGGNWVTAWGGRQKVSEARPDGTRVFNLDFARRFSTYRANPILPTQLSARTVRSGMEEQFPRTALSLTGAAAELRGGDRGDGRPGADVRP